MSFEKFKIAYFLTSLNQIFTKLGIFTELSMENPIHWSYIFLCLHSVRQIFKTLNFIIFVEETLAYHVLLVFAKVVPKNNLWLL